MILSDPRIKILDIAPEGDVGRIPARQLDAARAQVRRTGGVLLVLLLRGVRGVRGTARREDLALLLLGVAFFLLSTLGIESLKT